MLTDSKFVVKAPSYKKLGNSLNILGFFLENFQKLGKGAEIQGFLGYIPRKLGFHESVKFFQ